MIQHNPVKSQNVVSTIWENQGSMYFLILGAASGSGCGGCLANAAISVSRHPHIKVTVGALPVRHMRRWVLNFARAWGLAGSRQIATEVLTSAVRQVRALPRLGVGAAGSSRAAPGEAGRPCLQPSLAKRACPCGASPSC